MRILKTICLLNIFLLAGILNGSAQLLKGRLLTNETKNVASAEIVGNELVFESRISSLDYKIITKYGLDFLIFETKGFIPSGEAGEPHLLSLSRLFEMSDSKLDQSVYFEILDSTIIDLNEISEGIRIYPRQSSQIKSDTIDSAFDLKEDIYNKSGWSEEPVLSYIYQGKLRGLSISSLVFNPLRYNPGEGLLIIYHRVKATIKLPESDYLPENLKTPAFNRIQSRILRQNIPTLKKAVQTDHPMTMVILSDTMFRSTLQPLIDWKEKKGFRIIEVYTQDPGVGNTRESIKTFLRSLYENPPTGFDPATFLLLVGDVEQIPRSQESGYVTDLYYAEYDGGGDYIPDLFYGRISVSADSQLISVIDKILEYEQYDFPDPSFLDHSVLIAGYDSQHGSIEANGQINYVHNNYLNISNGYIPHVFLHPEAASQDSLIRALVSEGASFVNYTGHGVSTGWLDPSFNTSHISGMTNQSKYPLMIGNGCQTNVFTLPECFAEALLRAKDKGAIAYIGCTYDSYWDDDFYWSVGVGDLVSDPTYESTGLGYYDKVFHLNEEDYRIWAPSAGEMIFAGNMSVQESNSSRKKMYWEIYQLMGDPSLAPWFKVPVQSPLSFPGIIPVGSERLNIIAQPYDYIALSKSGTLITAAHADHNGFFNIVLPDTLTPGYLTLVATGDNRAPVVDSLLVGTPEGGFLELINFVYSDESVEADQVISNGEAYSLDLTFINRGNMAITTDTITLKTTDNSIVLLDTLLFIDSILPGDTSTMHKVFRIETDPDALPESSFTLVLENSSGILNRHIFLPQNISAPGLISLGMDFDDRQYGNGNGIAEPGEVVEVFWNIRNSGDYRSNLLDISDMSHGDPGNSNYLGFNKTDTIESGQDISLCFRLRFNDVLLDTIYSAGPFQAGDGNKSIIDSLIFNPWRHTDLFSSGDFTKYHYQNNDLKPWRIDSTVFRSASYSVRSGSITDYGSSEFSISFNSTDYDSISFNYKVSSEFKYDYLRFYIDSVEVLIMSGIKEWERFSAEITPGEHTVRWVYTKDQSISIGADAAWVDDIIFPRSAFTGIDVSLVKYVSPVSGPWLTENENLSVLLKNTGKDTIQRFYSHYTVDDHLGVPDTFDIILPPGDSIIVMLDEGIDFSAFSSYTIWCQIRCDGDMYPVNNILEELVDHYTFPDLGVQYVMIDSIAGVFTDLTVSFINEGNIRQDSVKYIIRIEDKVTASGSELIDLEPEQSFQKAYRLIDSTDVIHQSGWYDYTFEIVLTDSIAENNKISGRIYWQVLSLKDPGTGDRIAVFPNPAEKGFTVSFSREITSDIKLSIWDANGRLINEIICEKGTRNMYVEISGASGVYYLGISGSEKIIKLIKY